MLVLFILMLCICVIFVGCGKQATTEHTLPKDVSQEFYNDTLSALKKLQKVCQNEKLTSADNGEWEFRIKYVDKNGEYKKQLSEKEKEIHAYMSFLYDYTEYYLEDGDLSWSQEIDDYLQKLSGLLDIDLSASFEREKIIIKGI